MRIFVATHFLATMANGRLGLPAIQAHRVQQASEGSLGFIFSHLSTPLCVLSFTINDGLH